jgi:PAS domain S-box-containing protein
MENQSSESAQWRASVGNFGLLLLAVFTTELALMELLCPLFSRLGRIASSLMAAGFLVALLALPLSYFLTRLYYSEANAGLTSIRPGTLVKVLSCVFLIEFLVMLELPTLYSSSISPLACDLMDASLTSVLCAPPLWRMLFRPEMRRRSVPLMGTPLRLYLLLLCTVFVSYLMQDQFLPFRAGNIYFAPNKIVDSFLTTLIGAPLFWYFVARPLYSAAIAEKTRVEAIQTQVVDALINIDPQGMIGSFNLAAELIFGYSAAEMIGTPAERLFTGGQERLNEILQGAIAAADRPQILSREINCRRRSGLTLFMDLSIVVVRLDERPEFLLIMRDVTGRKKMEGDLRESETRFRQVFHQSEDGILFLEPGGSVLLDANEKAESIFGYSKPELKAGGFDRICASADPPGLAGAIMEVNEETLVRQDFICLRKDQTEIIVSLRARRMLLQGGAVTYCSFRDVTERVRQAEKTREIQARLIQTNKMTSLGLLVSGVAHEINNPNNFISANCEILAKISEDMLKALEEYSSEQGDQGIYLGGIPLQELGDQTRRLIEGIGTGSRRVTDIVTNLKGFARQERTQQKHEVDVSQVARSAVSLMDHELIKFTDNFHLELAEHLPPVSGHGQQLGQVIINLLLNACQALPGRGSGVWLATGFDPVKDLVTISVRDEGKGMPEDVSNRVLEPFFSTKLDSGGTGLGLSISDSIVKEHGGVLEFSSNPGEGTTFTVKIPAARPQEKEQGSLLKLGGKPGEGASFMVKIPVTRQQEKEQA